MDDPNKQPDRLAIFKAPMDYTKNPPQLRRSTLEEAYSTVGARGQALMFFAVAELVGRLVWGTWDKIKAARAKDHR